MPPRVKTAKLPPDQLAAVALRNGRTGIMRQGGVGEDCARMLRKMAGATIEEFREMHRADLQHLVTDLGARLKDEVAALSPYQKVIAYGILTDKLHNQPQSVSNSLHIHLKGGDSSSALRSILGPAADKLLAAKPVAPITDV